MWKFTKDHMIQSQIMISLCDTSWDDNLSYQWKISIVKHDMIIVSKFSICDTCDTLRYTKKFNAMLLRISTYFWYKAWQEQLYCKFSKFCIFCFFRDSNSLLLYKLATFMICKFYYIEASKFKDVQVGIFAFLCNVHDSIYL